MAAVIGGVLHTVFVETLLPHLPPISQLSLHPERESTFNELRAFLQGLVYGRGDEQMHMIVHDHEFVNLHSSLVAIIENYP